MTKQQETQRHTEAVALAYFHPSSGWANKHRWCKRTLTQKLAILRNLRTEAVYRIRNRWMDAGWPHVICGVCRRVDSSIARPHEKHARLFPVYDVRKDIVGWTCWMCKHTRRQI